jgi:hypothetical protein
VATLINAYCTVRSLPPLDFPHVLNSQRDLSDPQLALHLKGFVGYVINRCGGGKMTPTRYAVMRHIQRVQHQLSLNLQEKDLARFGDWAWRANAICLWPDGTVRTPGGSVLAGPREREPDANARMPYPQDAVARKAATEKKLVQLGVRWSANLPPVIGEPEVTLRPAGDVARRALALFTVALRGESLAGGDEIPVSDLRHRLPLSFEAMSPKEIAFLKSSKPEKQDITNAVWGYESVSLLLWATGSLHELAPPTRPCDVPQISKLMITPDQNILLKSAVLRPAVELLDSLDFHFRLHWAVRQARLDGKNPPSNFNADVISERHHALNWLVRFGNAEWDDVDTPT